jgi:hypothetical protein
MSDSPSGPPRAQPCARVIEQRIRNRVIESLELAGSFDQQDQYRAIVPFVNVAYEVINGFGDVVPSDPRTDAGILSVYTASEVTALGAFYDAWRIATQALPDNFPSNAHAQSLPEWIEMRAVAHVALAVFELRGRMSEDREVD